VPVTPAAYAVVGKSRDVQHCPDASDEQSGKGSWRDGRMHCNMSTNYEV
jgi:hypothetical protein